MNRFLTLLVLTVALAGPAGASDDSPTPMRVYASIVPIATLVERVGGDRVAVETLVGPAASPATYEPTPRQMAGLSDSRAFFRVGVPFERAWMDRIAAANPDMVVVDLREGLSLRGMAPHHHGDDGDHGDHPEPQEGAALSGHGAHPDELDPHVWTDPRNALAMAGHIRDRLIALDPAGEPAYRDGYKALAAQLEALDRELRDRLNGLRHRVFLVYHPAWGYFAEAYDLEQVPVEVEGREPGPRALAGVIERARKEGIRVIFVQSQFSRRSAEVVARAIDGRVVMADPLAADYVDNLRRVGRAFAEAME